MIITVSDADEVYQIAAVGSNRTADEILSDHGINPEKVDYSVQE